MTKHSKVSDVFSNITILIVGLGTYKEGSGISAALFFARHGARVIVNDARDADVLGENAQIITHYDVIESVFGRHDISLVLRADVIFQNPGVPDSHEMILYARTKKKPIINDWTLFFLLPTTTCVGVTGTRGKSTTTSMLYEMIHAQHNDSRLSGNIGSSPLTFIENYKNEIVVAEFSSWLLRGLRPVQKSPHIAVVTNMMRDHMNMYRSMRAYIHDKKEIFRYQKKTDHLILNYDNLITRRMGSEAVSKVWFVSMKPLQENVRGVYVADEHIMIRERPNSLAKKVLDVSELSQGGVHGIMNTLCAIAGARAMKIDMSHIVSVAQHFVGLPYRMQHIRTWKGVAIYNDSAATSPDATMCAVRALKETQPLILITGGMDKSLHFQKWAREIARCTHSVVTIPGSATDRMVSELAKYNVEVQQENSLADAVQFAFHYAQKHNGTILFSPGATSFNLFKNEFDRGEKFNQLIAKL